MRFARRLLAPLAFCAASLPLSAGALSSPTSPASPAARSSLPRGGALVLDHAHLRAFVADADNAALHSVDLSSGDVVTTPLECAPQEILQLDDARLAVSLRGCGKVAILSVSASGDATLEGTVEVAAEPWGLALSPTGTLLVTSAWGHALTLIDPTKREALSSLDLPREPRGVVLSPDGKRAFVTHAVGESLSVVDFPAEGGEAKPLVRAVRSLGGDHRNRVDRAAGAGTTHPTASHAYTAIYNEAGTRLFIPHVLVQNGRDTSRFVSGGYGGVSVQEDTSVASVAVLSAATEKPLSPAGDFQAAASLAPIHTDFLGTSAVAPSGAPSRQARAAAVLEDALFVTSYGTGQLVELDAAAIDPAMSVRRTFDVGDGPAGLDTDSATGIAVVWSQLSHELAVVNLGSGTVERIPVSADPLSADMALGRRLFHAENDRRISRDGRSCAGCHPDGRADGLVWRLGGGARKTLLLAGRLEHGPYGWNGEHAVLDENIDETIHRLGGSGLSKPELAALSLYVKRGLVPPPPEKVTPAAAQAVISRGKALFESDQVGCYWCHKPDQEASDRALHDVGSRGKDEERTSFRTPPLRFLAGAGPYFHDGRYETLEAVIDQNLDRMGNTTSLSSDDRTALVAFLRSL